MVVTIPEQEESILIRYFAPSIYIVGLGLLRERRGDSRGGVLTRGLESDDGEQRCIQYLYVYTQQMGVVSFFWNVVLPFKAISHPMRIDILKALAGKPMGFADLKRNLRISSSGLLDFHLKKMKPIVTKNCKSNAFCRNPSVC